MKKLLTIAKDASIKVNSNVTDYLLPSEVFLPITLDVKMLIKKKKVKKGSALYSFNQKTFYSPISGMITNVVPWNQEKDSYYLNIKNDFQEDDDYEGVSEFTTVSIRTDFKDKVRSCEVFDWSLLEGKTELILNGIEDEPYIANKPFLHKLYASEIMTMLDMLSDTFQIGKVSLCLKESDRESIEAFSKYIGTYLNFELKILPDQYPIGHEMVLRSYLKLSEEAVVLSSETVWDMYQRIVRNREKDVILVTLTGDAIHNPQVVRVKIGTVLAQVVEDLIQFKEEKHVILVNGLLSGYEVTNLNIVLTSEVRAIYFMKEKKDEEKSCIHCGKCIEVCPFHCNPYRTYFNKGKEIPKSCIHCGLCSFICPSKIPLNQYLKGERHE